MSALEVTTTLKLQTCSFSEQRIYPGHGQMNIRRDGKTQFFVNKKCASLSEQKIKPQKVRWTPTWRRAHKKAATHTSSTRKRTRATTKTQKAISGMTVEQINAIKAQKGSASARAPLPK